MTRRQDRPAQLVLREPLVIRGELAALDKQVIPAIQEPLGVRVPRVLEDKSGRLVKQERREKLAQPVEQVPLVPADKLVTRAQPVKLVQPAKLAQLVKLVTLDQLDPRAKLVRQEQRDKLVRQEQLAKQVKLARLVKLVPRAQLVLLEQPVTRVLLDHLERLARQAPRAKGEQPVTLDRWVRRATRAQPVKLVTRDQ